MTNPAVASPPPVRRHLVRITGVRKPAYRALVGHMAIVYSGGRGTLDKLARLSPAAREAISNGGGAYFYRDQLDYTMVGPCGFDEFEVQA